MKSLKAISVAWCNRPRKTLADLNDWALAFIGGPSFLVGSFYLLVVSTTTPDLLVLTRDHGLPLKAILAFVFLGGLAVSAWFFLNFARRCNELLYERNFN